MKFKADIRNIRIDFEKYAKAMELDTHRVIKRIALELRSDVIFSTPVDSGTARSNWNISKGTPDTTYTELPKGVHGSTSPVSEANAILKKKLAQFSYSQKDRFAKIFITNATPYISMLEYGTYPNPGKLQPPRWWQGRYRKSRVYTTPQGFSLQAPRGMVRIAYYNALARIAANVKALRAEGKDVSGVMWKTSRGEE